MEAMTPEPGVDDAKRALRLAVRARRQAQWRWLARLRSRAMCRRLASLSAFRRARLVLGYAAVRGEADPGPALALARRMGTQVALPRMAGPHALEFFTIAGSGDLVRGPFGIPEPRPDPGRRVDPRTAGLVLVPGTVFSLTGERVGAGGGYYDALLRHRAGPAVGLAFDLQLVATVPVARHDQRLDALVTERRTLLFGAA
jgi:5-formyltetrahydrofolate cyclo-ligase